MSPDGSTHRYGSFFSSVTFRRRVVDVQPIVAAVTQASRQSAALDPVQLLETASRLLQQSFLAIQHLHVKIGNSFTTSSVQLITNADSFALHPSRVDTQDAVHQSWHQIMSNYNIAATNV
jgi:hypothetical protein